MRSTSCTRQPLSAAENRLVVLGVVMKVGACALVCAVLTLIALTAIEHEGVEHVVDPGASDHAAAMFTSLQGLAASARRELYEERRARFDVARGAGRAIETAEFNNAGR